METEKKCIYIIFLSATRTSSQVTFPVDFFEHNQQLTEVEFGGNDLLQVYNGQQIKHRLNSTGMYVANTKVRTFSILILSHFLLLKLNLFSYFIMFYIYTRTITKKWPVKNFVNTL